MPGDLLKEYLIALGFNIKDDQYRKFVAGISRSTKEVAGLGETAIATAAAIGYMVEKAARQYEDLYYVSQRTGRSVIALKAYEFASRQVGVSAEAARGQTEAFYATLRTNPGMQGLLTNLGSNAAGGPQDLVAGLKKKFGEGGYFVANRFAQMFGIDEQSFRTYWLNVERLAAAQQDSLKRQREAGVSSQENAAKFREYANSVDHLSDNFSILTTRIAQDWLPTANSVLPWVDGLIERFNKADKASDGLLGKLTSILGALGAGGVANTVLRKLLGINIGGGAGKLIGRGVAGGGVVGFAVEAAVAMKADSQSGNSLRTGLRALLGIEDPNEPVPWAPRFRKNVLIGHKYDPRNGAADEKSVAGSDRDMLIRTVLGEAANQSDTGQEAVAEVVLNRLKSGRYGKSLQDVVLAPKQFEPWQTRRDELMAISPDSSAYQRTAMLVDKVLRGEIADPTHGATHFANVGTVRARGNSSAMSWINDMVQNGSAVQIGDHLFGSPNSQPGAGRFNANLSPSPMATAGAAVTINHDTDINIFGNADKAAQTAITNAQFDIYSQAVRNNLPRTR